MSKENNLALQSIVKGSGFLFAGQVLNYMLAFFTQLLLARYLGPKEFGIIALGTVVVGIGTFFVRVKEGGNPQAGLNIAEFGSSAII